MLRPLHSSHTRFLRESAFPDFIGDCNLSYSYADLPCESVESRRRRLFAQCSHHAINEPPRSLQRAERGDVVDVSVKRRSEELVRAARGNARIGRLNVEAGWSKVEEVRKKFEGASQPQPVLFSRSFESPPRRRLADSLFASFKLPRRKETSNKQLSKPATSQTCDSAMAAPARVASAPQYKRKSAVELLAESKALYVKSETVRDRKQELPLRVSSGLGQAIAAGGPISSAAVNSPSCCPYGSTPRPLTAPGGARRAGSGDIQSTLRRLLGHTDSRDNVFWLPACLPHKTRSQHAATLPMKQRAEGTTDDRTGSYSILSTPSSPEGVSLPAPVSPLECDELEDVGAISPPAQYAHSTHERYVRSNSQTAAPVRRDSCDEADCNINSHKSLPDLHTHASVSTSGAETMGRSPRRRRHSTHQRTASCSSKGTRSNHSSLVSSCEAFSEHPSPGEEYSYTRCGSSFARDSGGSSGHYTQHSAPPHRQNAHRTDSNSSGQHSHNRSHYATPTYAEDPLPSWPVSAPPQFQDGAPSPPPPPLHYPDTRVSIHFQASAPPPQFQDEPDAPRQYSARPVRCRMPARPDRPRDYTRFDASPDELRKTVIYAEPRPQRPLIDDTAEYVNTAQVHGGGGAAPEDATSPLGTFTRQRALRYKQRRSRPILRSKSDISDSRYRRPDSRAPASAPPDDSSSTSTSSSERLDRFFQHLGLERRAFESLLSHSHNSHSPVFFSDVSTVDSNQMALATDYTVNGPPQSKQPYRSAEPPSVVERNARIIKWLCNCRKMQIAQ